MQAEGYSGDRPLILRVLVGIRRYVLFERLSDTDQDARRAAWPLWRRAVRPVGAIAWWAGAIPGTLTGHHVRIDGYGGLLIVSFVVLVCCLLISGIDKIREYRRSRAT